MDDAHPSELAGAASSSTRNCEKKNEWRVAWVEHRSQFYNTGLRGPSLHHSLEGPGSAGWPEAVWQHFAISLALTITRLPPAIPLLCHLATL